MHGGCIMVHMHVTKDSYPTFLGTNISESSPLGEDTFPLREEAFVKIGLHIY